MSSWNHGRGPAPTGGLAESDRLDGVDAEGFRQDLQTAPESSRRFGVATRRYRTHHVRIGHSRQHGAGREGLRSSAVLQRGSPPAPAGPPSWRWSSPGRRSSRCAGREGRRSVRRVQAPGGVQGGQPGSPRAIRSRSANSITGHAVAATVSVAGRKRPRGRALRRRAVVGGPEDGWVGGQGRGEASVRTDRDRVGNAREFLARALDFDRPWRRRLHSSSNRS